MQEAGGGRRRTTEAGGEVMSGMKALSTEHTTSGGEEDSKCNYVQSVKY
jgi:hypothetical protein